MLVVLKKPFKLTMQVYTYFAVLSGCYCWEVSHGLPQFLGVPYIKQLCLMPIDFKMQFDSDVVLWPCFLFDNVLA